MPPLLQMPATSARPSPSKSPATHLVESIQPPSCRAQSLEMNDEPVDRRTVSMVDPSCGQIATMSSQPSPLKSPATHLIVSPHPPFFSAHPKRGSNRVPVDR